LTESTSMAAPWGGLSIFWEGGRLLRVILMPECDLPGNEVEERAPQKGTAHAAHLWLRRFLEGQERQPFPRLEELLDEAGVSGFQRRVMEEAARIGFGKTRSYSQLVIEEAARIGFGKTRSYSQLALDAERPGAARAVGNVMSANPFPLLVPCHRVVSASGEPGGFRWGTELKVRLLSWEGDLLK